MRFLSLAIALTFGLVAAPAQASSIVYDNLNTAPLGFYIGGFTYAETADDILLGPGGRLLESLTVAYAGFNFDGDESLTVTLYAMDGAPTPGSDGHNTPGTVLYTETRSIAASLGTTVTFDGLSGLNINLPDHVAVGLAFGGVDFDPAQVNSDAGPLLYGQPTVGSSFDDYWLRGVPNAGDPWSLFTFNGNPPVNFGLQLMVSDPVGGSVPEPATMGLVAAGLAGALARSARRRRARR